MKSSPFSLFTDSSNDRNLEKMSPLTAKLFDEDEHKYVTQFLDMCLGKYISVCQWGFGKA